MLEWLAHPLSNALPQRFASIDGTIALQLQQIPALSDRYHLKSLDRDCHASVDYPDWMQLLRES